MPMLPNENVLQDRHRLEETQILESSGYSGGIHDIRTLSHDVLAIDKYLTAIASEHARGNIDEGRFAGAIGPDEAMNRSRLNIDPRIIESCQATETLLQTGNVKERSIHDRASSSAMVLIC
jgi:hypothetical protein